MVTTDEQGYRAVKYHKLPLLLLEAVREEDQERKRLEGRVQELEQERAAQARRIADLEAKLERLAEKLK